METRKIPFSPHREFTDPVVRNAPAKPMEQAPRNRKVAIALALAGAFKPIPVPLSGLHKFYLGQPVWGTFYLLFAWTQIPRIACAIEGVWYLSQSDEVFQTQRGSLRAEAPAPAAPEQVTTIATALRELDKLRQDGLITEHEFEQKRRRLLEQMG